MAVVIETKKDDLYPAWTLQVRRRDPTTDQWVLDDLSDVTAVSIFMKETTTGTLKINGSAGSVSDLDDALISYQPVSGDTDTVGTYTLEYRLIRNGGKPMTLPKREYEPVYVIINEDNRA